MFRALRAFYLRVRSSKNYTNDLDAILSQTDPNAPLFDRLSWLIDLMQWIRYRSYLVDYKEVENVKRPVVRLRFLLMLLERNPEWKTRVAKTLRSILIDTRDVELFASTGLPEELGFWSELFNRFTLKIMPARPLSEGGIQVFSALFPAREDLEWFAQMPPEIMQRLIDLVMFEKPPGKNFSPVIRDIEDALLILASQVRSIGMAHQIRRRVAMRVKDSPFFDLTLEMEVLLATLQNEDRTDFRAQAEKFQGLLARCFEVFNGVYRHLDEHGVSLKVVYLIELGQAKLKRIQDLIDLLADEKPNAERLIYFISQLIEENQEKHGLWSLFEQNTRLISQKIVERSAETGEHYITKNREEYKRMFRRAQGGGALMSLTVLMKVLLGGLRLPDFMQGFAYSINYSVSFVAIQLNGFTVATKQPAMTGPALAAKLQEVHRGKPMDLLVDEIVKLIRSQMVGIFGNVGMVIPCIILMDLLYYVIFKSHMIQDAQYAEQLITSSHIFGFSALFAAFTGVLLWLSSICAGYVDNWFYLNRMRDTIRYNRRLNYVIGKSASEKLALFLERNASSLTSNITLGFFLGMTPQIMAFLGLFLDVRHVTLSSGNLALGAMHFGWSILTKWDFWLSFMGLGVIGLLNVGVSFGLAFWVALKSRHLRGGKKSEIYQAVIARFKKDPWSFAFPPKEKRERAGNLKESPEEKTV